MEKFGRLESTKTTTANLGNSWWPQTGKQEGDDKIKLFNAIYWKIVVNAQASEVSRLGIGTVLRLERNSWSTVK